MATPQIRPLTFVALLGAIAAFGVLAGSALAKEAPADKAVLYVVRVDSTPLLDTAFILADEEVLRPYLFGKQYARHELQPGSYTFIAGRSGVPCHPKRGWIHGDLEAGKTYGIVVGFNNSNPFAAGWHVLALDESFQNYDRAMALVSGKPPKDLDEKKQQKAEKQYQKMRARDEKKRSKGKPTWFESTRDLIAKREAKNPDLRRTLKPMTETPLPPER